MFNDIFVIYSVVSKTIFKTTKYVILIEVTVLVFLVYSGNAALFIFQHTSALWLFARSSYEFTFHPL